MKTIPQISFKDKNGEPLKLLTPHEGFIDATTTSLIFEALDNFPYVNVSDLMTAFEIKSKLKTKVIDDKIELEDAEYKFIKEKVTTFTPYIQSGLRFIDFFLLLETHK